MNAQPAGRIAGLRFARSWKDNLDLWTPEKLMALGQEKGRQVYQRWDAVERFAQGFVQAVETYQQQKYPAQRLMAVGQDSRGHRLDCNDVNKIKFGG